MEKDTLNEFGYLTIYIICATLAIAVLLCGLFLDEAKLVVNTMLPGESYNAGPEISALNVQKSRAAPIVTVSDTSLTFEDGVITKNASLGSATILKNIISATNADGENTSAYIRYIPREPIDASMYNTETTTFVATSAGIFYIDIYANDCTATTYYGKTTHVVFKIVVTA